MKLPAALCAVPVLAAILGLPLRADPESILQWSVTASGYRFYPDITYAQPQGKALKLDVTVVGTPNDPKPTLLYIHGGGWVGGTRADKTLAPLPFLAEGMDVVNIDYRLAKDAPAPAAVDDCRTALRWVYAHAGQYGFDPHRIVVAGESAGGHLALMAVLLEMPNLPVRPAAVVSYSGPIDLLDLMHGPHPLRSTPVWLGPESGRDDLARRMSPLNYVRPGLPPIILVHGNPDLVDYSQAVRFHLALDRANDPNVLITVPGLIHGWNVEKNWDAQRQVFAALERYGVLPLPSK